MAGDHTATLDIATGRANGAQVCTLWIDIADGMFTVNSKAKLLEAIQRHPAQVRFADACKAAGLLGFVHVGGKGSHRSFARVGELVELNFQNRNGFVPPYQAR